MSNQRISSSPPFMIAGRGLDQLSDRRHLIPESHRSKQTTQTSLWGRILSEPAAPGLQLGAAEGFDRTGQSHIASGEEVVERLATSRWGLGCAVDVLRLQRHHATASMIASVAAITAR
jgi:hypothetical protein